MVLVRQWRLPVYFVFSLASLWLHYGFIILAKRYHSWCTWTRFLISRDAKDVMQYIYFFVILTVEYCIVERRKVHSALRVPRYVKREPLKERVVPDASRVRETFHPKLACILIGQTSFKLNISNAQQPISHSPTPTALPLFLLSFTLSLQVTTLHNSSIIYSLRSSSPFFYRRSAG